jgi:alpha-D-ribose 1-methylphosphonate 5-triphosphate synthase subunit PhnG
MSRQVKKSLKQNTTNQLMPTVTQRQAWMATLAKAELELLEKTGKKIGYFAQL